MIKTILSSRFCSTHKRCNGVRAAIDNPLNKELVTQLARYISDETLEELKHKKEDAMDTEVREKVSAPDDVIDNQQDEIAKPDVRAVSDSPDDSVEIREPSEKEHSAEDDIDVPDEEKEPEAVKSSTQTIETATALYRYPGTYESFASLCNIVKGTLNSRQDTSGVTRTCVKGDELWVYYNDNTNLNNIMTEVVDVISSPADSTLAFNRLARSDNAIVFEIAESASASEGDDNVKE